MDEYGCGFLTEADRMQQRDYSLSAMATRFELAEMPSGRRTFHRLSLSSTLSRMDASPGGYSAGDSTTTKSRPMWVMPMHVPLTMSRISTWAECAPYFCFAIMKERIV